MNPIYDTHKARILLDPYNPASETQNFMEFTGTNTKNTVYF